MDLKSADRLRQGLNPTSPVSNEIQKDMVIFRGMSFVGC